MELKRYKKWYLIVSFVLSLFLVLATILSFTSISHDVKEPIETAARWILWFFVAELVVLFIIAPDLRTFFKEQWLSILAVVTSISVTQLLESVAAIGSLTGFKAVKSLSALKSLKGLKGMKLFKATKGVKFAKSYKIGKKASQAVVEVQSVHAQKPRQD